MVSDAALLEHLSGFMTPQRRATFEAVLALRTRHLTVVVEDIYQPHNASAVLRSCDCFGIQDVHIVEIETEYNVNPGVALGASKWLSLHKYSAELHPDPVVHCLDQLKSEGYSVLATTPHTEDLELSEIPIEQKTALVFGNEGRGISDTVKSMADGFVRIPMVGFTESFNISVSAALCLYDFTTRLRKSEVPWQLSDEEHFELLLEWTRASIKDADRIEALFWERHGASH